MRNLNEVIRAVEELQKLVASHATEVESLRDQVAKLVDGKQRGPKTDRPMTDMDAYRVKFGDLVELNHKEAAAKLGLSYGQVFSCRGGYTFKHIRNGVMPKPDATPDATAAPEAQ